MELTEEQKRIVAHSPAQHACVVAGPGTGKSSTMIALGSRLLQEGFKGVKLLTFTRAATGELAGKVVKAGVPELAPSTIHSFAISVLLQNPGSGGMPEPLRILDDWEWETLARTRFRKQLRVDYRVVERLKQEMASNWESLQPEPDPTVTEELRRRFQGSWDEQRAVFGYTLLSELPYRLRHALQSHADLRLGDLTFLIVDEFQDLNACDLECLNLLSKRGVVLCAVGDDDQSIYRFRKAHPIGIREFPTKYQATPYELSVNLRCGKAILDWATHVIEQDPDRHGKKPATVDAGNPVGEARFLEFAGHAAEAKGVAALVAALVRRRNVPLNEILILCRSDHNGQFSGPIREALDALGIASANPEALVALLDEKPARLFLSLLRLLVSREDSMAWWTRLFLTPRIGERSIETIIDSARASGRRFAQVLLDLHANGQLESIGGRMLSQAVAQTLKSLDRAPVPKTASWGQWIGEAVQAGLLPNPGDELLASLQDMDPLVEEGTSLDRFLGQVQPLLKDLANATTGDAVRIMKMAGSKGLTVRACIVIACERGIIPLEGRGTDIHEERRLLYVAMTRPTEFLFLTRARQRRGATARAGGGRSGEFRTMSPFLEGGSVRPIDGQTYIRQMANS